jgi:hypothetical protein
MGLNVTTPGNYSAKRQLNPPGRHPPKNKEKEVWYPAMEAFISGTAHSRRTFSRHWTASRALPAPVGSGNMLI